MRQSNIESALERGKTKLGLSFDLRGLPKDVNNKIWDKIFEKYQLELDELGALQNEYANQQPQQGKIIKLIMNSLLHYDCQIYMLVCRRC